MLKLLKFFIQNILYLVMYKMAILSKIKSHPYANNYFIELPFYTKPIERPIKRLKYLDPLAELPFYAQLHTKTDQAFKGYAMSYEVKIIEKKDPIVQLEASKLSVKNLFNDLLNELKGFNYQITMEVLLKNASLMEKLNLDQFIFIQ